MRAAIYTRISNDKTGEALGVERQEQECRQLCQLRGWTVEAVYTDNSISAFSGKHRPAYEELLHGIEHGAIDVVIAWNHDRLNRRPRELERYVDICERARVDTYTVRAGHFDLSTPSGRAIARTLAAWASYETETSTERVKAAKLQQAKAGKWSGGQRPYGYEPACAAIRETEAAIVRELAARVIAGESFNRLAWDLNRRGVLTTNGKEWNALKVRNMLSHARYAGIREHNGVHYPAEWPAIIDQDTWDELQAAIVYNARQYTQRGPMRKFLLTGFAYCGKCGNRMNTAPRQSKDGGYTRYVCRKVGPTGEVQGCGTVSRRTDPVDLLVSECIIYRLETDEFDRMLEPTDDTKQLREALARQATQRERIQEIRDGYATGELDKDEYRSLLAMAQSTLEELSGTVERLGSKTSRRGLPASHRARGVWESAHLQQRRDIVDALIERVVINPSSTVGMKRNEYWNGYQFRPEDVEIEWKA